MKLNKKILKAIENGYEQQNVERFDFETLKRLEDSLYNEELVIADFATLANIYDIKYKFKIYVPGKTVVIDQDAILHYELDKLYYELTCRRLNSFKLTLKELTAKFNEMLVMVVVI